MKVSFDVESTRNPSPGDWWTEIDGIIQIVSVMQDKPGNTLWIVGADECQGLAKDHDQEFWGPIPEFVPPTK